MAQVVRYLSCGGTAADATQRLQNDDDMIEATITDLATVRAYDTNRHKS